MLQRRPCMSSNHSRATRDRGMQALDACAELAALAPSWAGRMHVRVKESSCAQLHTPGQVLCTLAPYDAQPRPIAHWKPASAGARDEIRSRQRGAGQRVRRTGYGAAVYELGVLTGVNFAPNIRTCCTCWLFTMKRHVIDVEGNANYAENSPPSARPRPRNLSDTSERRA